MTDGLWDPGKEIAEVTAELAHPAVTGWDVGTRELEYAFPFAVRSIVQIALQSYDLKARLSASKAIVSYNFAIRQLQNDEANSPLERMLRIFEAETRKLDGSP